jgi:16S rRNA (cytosine1402-N4)-methyltransferase
MSGHIPVLLAEVMTALKPRDGAVYIDGTFGGGGYTRALLTSAECEVIAIDRDPDAIARGAILKKEFGSRLTIIEGNFSELDRLAGIMADGVALDIGVSSFQFDEAMRGFSFSSDGPLDMRMSASGMSAADAINTLSEQELADIFWRYGEEKKSRSIARAIIAARPVSTTRALAEIVEKAQGPAAKRFAIHPATRTFQALRIYVNDELNELERGLEAAERILKPSGVLAVVSFHSLEDRIVKRFLAERAGRNPNASRHQLQTEDPRSPTFRLLETAVPGDEEIRMNPRARSARLRAAERTPAPAWSASSSFAPSEGR